MHEQRPFYRYRPLIFNSVFALLRILSGSMKYAVAGSGIAG